MNEVVWTDVAPRDGLQNIDDTIGTEAKIRLVRGLLDAGVPRVEATSFVSAAWVPQLADAPAVLAGLEHRPCANSCAHPQSPRSRACARAWRAQCPGHHRRDRLVQQAQRQSHGRRSRSTRSRTSSSWPVNATAQSTSPSRWRSDVRSRGGSRPRVSSSSARTSRHVVRRRLVSPTRSASRRLLMSPRCARFFAERRAHRTAVAARA